MPDFSEKLEKLKDILRNLESALVSYSGGVDSTLLLRLAHEVLGDKVVAVTVSSEIHPPKELVKAEKIAESIGVKHIVLVSDELNNPHFISNTPERCYVCKKNRFLSLVEKARELGLKHVIEGSNVDDLDDYRPGLKAVDELDIRSPLKEVGMTKEEIRTISREMGLITWDAPSSPCLVTRLPYGVEITYDKLSRIHQAEEFLKQYGIRELRVRDHGELARIEVSRVEMQLIIDDNIMQEIVTKFKSLGYRYITLDMMGFRSGSMNEALRGKG